MLEGEYLSLDVAIKEVNPSTEYDMQKYLARQAYHSLRITYTDCSQLNREIQVVITDLTYAVLS